MRPKKIYVKKQDKVLEDLASAKYGGNVLWVSPTPSVGDVEYTDLSQLWHSSEEQPQAGYNLLVSCTQSSIFGWNTMQMWYSNEDGLLHFPTETHIDCPPFKLSEIKSWAYISDLMQTPGRELDVKPFGAPDL